MRTWFMGKPCASAFPKSSPSGNPASACVVADWRIRRMKTRWGTCNAAARRIWLKSELAKKPLLCLQYVVVHEMVQRIARGPNPGRVEGWRADRRVGGYSVAFAPGRRPAPVVTFPAPAHRTGRADLPHPALSRDHAFAHGRCRVVSARRVRPHSSHSHRWENRTYLPDFTLCFRQNHCRSRRAAYASTAA